MAEEVEMCVEIASKIDNTWIEKADINLLCRACATETNENMIPIFEGTGLELDLQAKIDKHLPVKITKDDGLPNKMCVQCASTLVAWHDIYTGCTDAETKLKNLLNKSKDNAHTGDKVAGSSVEHEDPVTQKPESQQKVAGEMEVDDNDSDYIYEGDEDDDDYVQDDDDDIDEDGDEEQETEEVVIEKLDSKEKGKTVEITDKGTIIRDQVLVLDVGEKKAISLNLHRKENIVTLKLLSGFRDSSCFNGTFIEEFVEYVRKYHGLGDIDIEIEFESIEDDKMFNYFLNNDDSKSHICDTLATEINKVTSTAFEQAVEVRPYCKNSNLMISQDLKTHMNTYEFFNKTFNLSIGKSINNASSYSFSSSVIDKKDISSSAGQSSNTNDVRSNLHCNLCNRYFTNKHHLKAHNHIHSDKKYLCDVCGRKFLRKPNLRSHLLTHSDSEPYECPICHEKLKLKRYLRIHQIRKHKMDPKEVAKNLHDTCNKTPQKQPLISVSTGENINSTSSYSFSSNVLDEKDINSSAGQSSKDVRSDMYCNLCNKYFANKHRLKAHNHIHSEKKYVCDVCGKKFSMNPDLARHKLTHSDSKPYGCEICHQKFNQKRYLREHQVWRHKMDPKEVAEKVYGPKGPKGPKRTVKVYRHDEPYCCEECNANFKFPFQLSNHIKISHSNERPFECQVCNATFKLSAHLQKHSFVHGEKKHVCKTCGKKFSVRGDFKRHILIHTDLKPYLCNFCPKAFAVESYLKTHINRKHRIQATEVEKK